MKRIIRSLIPTPLLGLYHIFMVSLAACWYGFPGRELTVIGVTGTKGKSSTCILIGKILEHAGYKVGITTTALFKVADKEWLNATKMTMLGRFALQRILRDMVRAGCRYAVIETSSEGLAQHRNVGINYAIAVFTNLSPEHIESHGSFEKYRDAKGQLFQHVKKGIVVNLDDEHADYFLAFKASEKFGITLEDATKKGLTRTLAAHHVTVATEGARFSVDGTLFTLPLLGKGNIYNALLAIAVATMENIPLSVASQALQSISTLPGRFERIETGQPFTVLVDYAHEPRSFQNLYQTVATIPHQRIIHVFGATGGGRDKARRAQLGQIAKENADTVIVTTDDPYNEDPMNIATMVMQGVGQEKGKIILDRTDAIHYALREARTGDMVLITGKGSEQVMMVKGKRIPWDDREIVRKALTTANHASMAQ